MVKTKAVGVSAFGATLRPALMDPWMWRQFEGTTEQAPQVDSPGWRQIYEVVRNYWLAITELMPEAAADRARYSLQKPLGAYVFHEIMPEFLDLARRAGDFSPKFFQVELERLGEWIETPQWDTVGDVREPIVKANNRQAIEYIVGQMRQALRDVPSEQVTEVVLPTGAPAGAYDRHIGTVTLNGQVHDCEHCARNGHMDAAAAQACAKKLLPNYPGGTIGTRLHPVRRDRNGARVQAVPA